MIHTITGFLLHGKPLHATQSLQLHPDTAPVDTMQADRELEQGLQAGAVLPLLQEQTSSCQPDHHPDQYVTQAHLFDAELSQAPYLFDSQSFCCWVLVIAALVKRAACKHCIINVCNIHRARLEPD